MEGRYLSVMDYSVVYLHHTQLLKTSSFAANAPSDSKVGKFSDKEIANQVLHILFILYIENSSQAGCYTQQHHPAHCFLVQRAEADIQD